MKSSLAYRPIYLAALLALAPVKGESETMPGESFEPTPSGVLALLPPEPARNRGAFGADSAALAIVERALRMRLAQSGRYEIPSREELEIELARTRSTWPSDCQGAACLRATGEKLSADYALSVSVFLSVDSLLCRLSLNLARTGGKSHISYEVEGTGQADGLSELARIAAEKAVLPEEDSYAPSPRKGSPRILVWTGSALLTAMAALAWTQGDYFQEDGTGKGPARPLLPEGGQMSGLRGFFASPTAPPRYAAQGDAGLAHSRDALSLFINPAGIADIPRDAAALIKSTLPGEVPAFALAYAAPRSQKISQGYSLRYEGDDLANEITAQAVLAGTLSGARQFFPDVKAGLGVKLYLAQVGQGGTGLDRSRGHSVGAGLDLGSQWQLAPRIRAGVVLRDAVSLLRHRNTFTNSEYYEILPPLLLVGAAYSMPAGIDLAMDGQKGLYADQTDHVMLGGEATAFRVLRLRTGLKQVFSDDPVREFTLGFGLTSEGLDSGWNLDKHLEIAYSYSLALDPHARLGGVQHFSVEIGF